MAKKKAAAKKKARAKKKVAKKKVAASHGTLKTTEPITNDMASRPSESTVVGDKLVNAGQLMGCLGLSRSAFYEMHEPAGAECVLQHGTHKFYWLQETAFRYCEFIRLKLKQKSRGQSEPSQQFNPSNQPHPDSPAGMDLRMQRQKLRQMELKTANLEKTQASIAALERALDLHTSAVRDTVLTTANRMREMFADRMDHEMFTELEKQLELAVNDMAILELDQSDFEDLMESDDASETQKDMQEMQGSAGALEENA